MFKLNKKSLVLRRSTLRYYLTCQNLSYTLTHSLLNNMAHLKASPSEWNISFSGNPPHSTSCPRSSESKTAVVDREWGQEGGKPAVRNHRSIYIARSI